MHARRKFTEVIKAQGKSKNKKTGKAQRGLAFIQKLYKIEKTIRDAAVEERFAIRQEKAVPIIEQCRAWLDTSLPMVDKLFNV